MVTSHDLTRSGGRPRLQLVPVDSRVETTDPDLKHQIAAVLGVWFILSLKVTAHREPIYSSTGAKFASTATRWVAATDDRSAGTPVRRVRHGHVRRDAGRSVILPD